MASFLRRAAAGSRLLARCAVVGMGGLAVSQHVLGVKMEEANEVVQPDASYVGGIKIWGIGIREDPIKGTKRGKGMQALNSSVWVEDLSVFIAQHLPELKTVLAQAEAASKAAGYTDDTVGMDRADFVLLINAANLMLMKADTAGLKTAEARQQWLKASWLTMAAAEVQMYPYAKYTKEELAARRQAFFDRYREARDWGKLPGGATSSIPVARVDLIPQVALERLSLHNELCEVKWGDKATHWKRFGFPLSKRMSSCKRHLDGIYSRDPTEDHTSHLAWGFMAVYHVLCVFPEKNDLVANVRVETSDTHQVNE